MRQPLCFVLMPIGRKPAAGGRMIDFDAVYSDLIAPAIVAAGFEPLRAEEEKTGNIAHKSTFESLILCEHAVVDVTTANANVFYQLGLRHALRPTGTVVLFAKDASRLPFEVAQLRTMAYDLEPDGRPGHLPKLRKALKAQIQAARQKSSKSPVFQLVEEFPDIQRLKTDVFREHVDYAQTDRERLAVARRRNDVAALAKVADDLGPVADLEAGVVMDLFLSYRAVKAWDRMIALVDHMTPPLAAAAMVQEQLALALNRTGRGEEAEQVLIALIAGRGSSSETCGILGRVYKDRWEAALKQGEESAAAGLLTKAIDAYLQGFEADWRDAYPGINAVTLMEIAEPADPRRTKLIPVVAYAVERRIAKGRPDYWDYATLLELAVLAGKEQGAAQALPNVLAAVREPWEPETTARNLRLIREARTRRGEQSAWIEKIETNLLHRTTQPKNEEHL